MIPPKFNFSSFMDHYQALALALTLALALALALALSLALALVTGDYCLHYIHCLHCIHYFQYYTSSTFFCRLTQQLRLSSTK